MTTIRMIGLKQPSAKVLPGWLFFLFAGCMLIFASCSKEETHKVSLFLKTGVSYTKDGASVPEFGKISIGVLASGGGVPLTYIRIEKIADGETLTRLDKGFYAAGTYDEDFIFFKDTSSRETWKIMVMNADRDTLSAYFRIVKSAGTAVGEITYIPSAVIGLQDNHDIGHFLDLDNGHVYSETTVTGHEADVDMLGYFYFTSGLPSPSFSCPGYTAVSAYYPVLNSWPVKNNTTYDYASTDNNLISADQFDAAENDSLLITAYKHEKVSGNCKYCYTGKVVPFKTQAGKYGLIKVIRADQTTDGSMELAIKIQK